MTDKLDIFKSYKDAKNMQPLWTKAFNHLPNLHIEVNALDSQWEFLKEILTLQPYSENQYLLKKAYPFIFIDKYSSLFNNNKN